MENSMRADEIQEIKDLLSEADKQISLKSKNNILILGYTGTGKSTILNLIAGNRLKCIESDEGSIIIDAENPSTSFKIGHTASSCTSVPQSFDYEDYTLWDCPGFDGNISVKQEIADSYYITRIISLADLIKIVLVIEHGFKINKGQPLADVLIQLSSLFRNSDNLDEALSIVITKCPSRYKVENFTNDLRILSEENERFSSVIKLVSKVIEAPHRISLFKEPTNCNDIEFNVSQNIINSYKRSTFVKMAYSPTLGPSAQLKVDFLNQDYQEKIMNRLEQFSRILLERFSLTTDMEKLNLDKKILERINSSSINSVEEFENLLNELFEFFCDTNLEVREALNIIFRLKFFEQLIGTKQAYNILIWTKPLIDIKLNILERIDFQNQAVRKKQAEEFKKKHIEEIKGYERLTKELNEELEISINEGRKEREMHEADIKLQQEKICNLEELRIKGKKENDADLLKIQVQEMEVLESKNKKQNSVKEFKNKIDSKRILKRTRTRTRS